MVGQLGVVFGPEPAGTGPRDRDPGRDAPRADDHAPVLAVGVGRVRSRGRDVDPGDQGGIGGQRGLDFAEPGDLARQLSVILDQLGLELAQGDAGQLALVLQLVESLRPLGLVEVLGRAFHQLVEPFQLGGQFAEAGSFGGREPLVLAGGQLVEQAAAQVFLQRLPCLGRLTEPGQHGGQGGACGTYCVRPGAFQAREGDPEPRRVQALHSLVAIGLAPRGTSPGRRGCPPGCCS